MKKFLRFLAVASLFVAQIHAANTTISALPNATTLTGAEVLPVVQGGNTVKVPVGNLTQGMANATISVPGLMSPTDKSTLANATASATASTLVLRDGSGNAALNNITLTTGTISGTPSGSTDIANKAYVDAAASGLTVKTAARVATTGNITLSAPQTIDGVSAIAGDRVLVKNQVDATQNGIYVVAAGAWTRSTDADNGTKLVTNSYIFVTAGSVNFSTGWIMTTPNPITIGSSNIVWALYSALGSIPASSITGQIITGQIANLAITTAQFAANLTPVEIVGTLPGSGNFAGRTVFLTSDNNLYRYNGSAFIRSVATADLTGQITTTQITDSAITTPKLNAGSVTGSVIAAGTITAANIQANSLTAGTIQAGAIGTAELAVGGITGVKIANGTITATQIATNTITADRLTVSSLSAISANIGTITSGSLTSSVSLTVGAGTAAVSISSSGATFAGGRITLAGDGTNPFVRVKGVSPYNAAYMELNGGTSGTGPFIAGTDISGAAVFSVTSGAITFSETTNVDSVMQSLGGGSINLFGGSGNAISITCGEDGSAGGSAGYLVLQVNGRSVKVPFNNL